MKSKQIQKFQETEIGIIPEDWKINELQKISKVIDSAHITPEYSSNGFPMIRVTDIKSGFLDLKKSFKVTREVYEEFTKNHKPRKNDIVMGRVGTYGITSFVNTDEPFCLGQNTVVIHSPISRFIYYALNSKVVKNQIEEKVVGSTQKTISLANIRELLIAIPTDPNETEQIEKILFDLDLKISVLQIQNQTLEEIIQSIFKSWFINFDGQTEFVDSELGKIPKGWKIGKLDDVCDIFSGGTPSTKIQEYWNGDIPWLASGETRNQFILETERKITLLGVKNSSTRLTKKYDVVIASAGQGNTRGQVSFCLIDTYINQSVVALRSKNNFLYSNFLFSNLISRYEELRRISDSYSSRGSLPKILLSQFEILVPTENILNRFNNITKPIFQVIENNTKSFLRLKKIRDSLLPKLMSGEIRA